MATITLFQKLTSQDAAVRRSAQNELDRLDALSKKALIPELIEALNQDVRAFAATALWRMGPAAESALIAFLNDAAKDQIARHMAAFALEKFATPEAQAAVKRFRQPSGPTSSAI